MSIKFPLAADSFGDEEKQAVANIMASGHYTMGPEVKKFENEFASWVGAKHAVMVNSGSSANLLMIAALLTRSKQASELMPGDEILVPALSWPTTVWPIAQLGLVPVFVDIDPNTLAISVDSAKKALSSKTKGMFLIHVLGQRANMKEIIDFCNAHSLILLEDCCESFGTYFNHKHVGTFGFAGSYSHFFSHHLTTMEGGTIVTDDSELVNDLRSLRAHGWIRDRDDKIEISKQFPELDPRFLFLMTGFNVRPMEIQAAVGLVQLKKAETFLNQRDEIAKNVVDLSQGIPWLKIFGAEFLSKDGIFSSRRERQNSWMNIAFLVDSRAPISCEKVKLILEKNGIETRPIIAGNLARHPAIKKIKCKIEVGLFHSDLVLNQGFMIGCNPSAYNAEGVSALENSFNELKSL